MKRLFLSLLCILPCVSSYAYDFSPTKEDIIYWRQLAKQNDPEAEFNLGEAYLKGEGGLRADEKEAAKWYYKAAVQGYPDAQFAMGFVYRGGAAAAMDKIESYMWFELAAKNGDERAPAMRSNLAWSMTDAEIAEARRRASKWKPEKPED